MTLIPAKHTFTIWSGATFFEVLTLYETNDNTTPRDFCSTSGSTRTVVYTAEMIIREKPQGSPLFTLSSANGRIIFPTEIENIGQIRLLISDTDTAGLDWNSGVYDLTITKTNETPHITEALLYGGIKVAGV
jgi:hypothetical protein